MGPHIEHIRARRCVKNFVFVISFFPAAVLEVWGGGYPDFADEETEAQGHEVIFPKSGS